MRLPDKVDQRLRHRLDSPARSLPTGSSMKISEEAVFRWVVIVGVAAASVIALTLVTTPLVGALWALLLVLAGAVSGFRWWRAHR